MTAADWAERAVSHIEGRAAPLLRPRPLALIDIIGSQRGRPGCSRGWRAAGPVREPGSGAEAEKEAKERKAAWREGAPSHRLAQQILHRPLAPTKRRQWQCLGIES